MEAVGHLIEHFPELKIRLQTFISTGKRLSSVKRADVLSFIKDQTTIGKRNMQLESTQRFKSAVANMVNKHGSPRNVTETGSFESDAIDSTDKSQDATARSNASSVEDVRRFVKLERKVDELRDVQDDMRRKARRR